MRVAIDQAFADAGLAEKDMARSGALLGLAGANLIDAQERLARHLPFAQCAVASDALTALWGAHGEEDGTIAIVGTGSAFMSRQNGAIRSIGGWGFAVSDLGSGARLGRDLLEETILAYDGVHQGSALTDAVLQRFGGEASNLTGFASKAKPVDFATFAPLVLEHASKNDPVASMLLGLAVSSVDEALDAILPPDGHALCLMGGLGQAYQPLLADRHRRLLRAPRGSALDGAVMMAIQRFGAA